MESEVLKAAASQGLWAVLTVALIFYILKTQEKRDFRQEEREKSYQEMISRLTDELNVIDKVKEDIEEIKNYVYKSKSKKTTDTQ